MPAPWTPALVVTAAALCVLPLAGKAGDAAAPALVTSRPLLLLLLNANDLHCALTAARASPLPWLLVALARRLAEDPFFFYLGRAHRDAALRWLEALLGDGAPAAFERFEDAFRGASVIAVVLEPGACVCAAAGATRMRPLTFGLLNVSGTLARLLAIRAAGRALERPVAHLHARIAEFRAPLMAATVLLALASVAGPLRRVARRRTPE